MQLSFPPPRAVHKCVLLKLCDLFLNRLTRKTISLDFSKIRHFQTLPYQKCSSFSSTKEKRVGQAKENSVKKKQQEIVYAIHNKLIIRIQ